MLEDVHCSIFHFKKNQKQPISLRVGKILCKFWQYTQSNIVFFYDRGCQ